MRKAYGHLAFELSNLDTTTSSHRNNSSGSIEVNFNNGGTILGDEIIGRSGD